MVSFFQEHPEDFRKRVLPKIMVSAVDKVLLQTVDQEIVPQEPKQSKELVGRQLVDILDMKGMSIDLVSAQIFPKIMAFVDSPNEDISTVWNDTFLHTIPFLSVSLLEQKVPERRSSIINGRKVLPDALARIGPTQPSAMRLRGCRILGAMAGAMDGKK